MSYYVCGQIYMLKKVWIVYGNDHLYFLGLQIFILPKILPK